MSRNKGLSLNGQLGFIHQFKSMIESCEINEIGPLAFTVLLVIKAYCNFKTGKAIISIKKIHKLTGISKRQISREIKMLKDSGYLHIDNSKRYNTYTIIEKIFMVSPDTNQQAIATWNYTPTKANEAMNELKVLREDGDPNKLSLVNITNIQINFENSISEEIIDINCLDNLPNPTKEKLINIINEKFYKNKNHNY